MGRILAQVDMSKSQAAYRCDVIHSGEAALQGSLGVAGQMSERGRRLIRPFMADQHREFFEKLRLNFLGPSITQASPGRS